MLKSNCPDENNKALGDNDDNEYLAQQQLEGHVLLNAPIVTYRQTAISSWYKHVGFVIEVA